MKKLLLILATYATCGTCLAQSITETYPKTITANNDSVKIWYSSVPFVNKDKITHRMSPGIDAIPGLITYAVFGNSTDTVAIPCKSFPYEQRTSVWVETPNGKMEIIFRYNRVLSHFSEGYMDANKGKVHFEIPEVYELANIIWTLGPGKNDTLLYKKGDYYERVKNHFAPYTNHPVFSRLTPVDSNYFKDYSDFRENSFTFNYLNGKITRSDTYFYVTGSDWKNFTNLFKTLLPEVADFAEKSGFRDFYRNNAAFYATQTARLQELLPVKEMWAWLEKEFPATKKQSYKIIFSPLIGGSHSTQSFGSFNLKEMSIFGESVMFICGPDRYDNERSYTEKEKAGLMSGIVFTEIDHNYVNPRSDKFRKAINETFDIKNGWSKKQDFYDSPLAVFNEYMTHSVFCIWVAETFDRQTADKVIDYRVKMNAERRGFIRFEAFNNEMMRLRIIHKEMTVAELYPLILDWCKNARLTD